MANSIDPDQLALKPTDLDLHCLQRQGISRFSRTRVKISVALQASKLVTCHCSNKTRYEPSHDKTNKMACVPRDQPGQMPRLI